MLLKCACCVHHSYCHLDPEKDGGICAVVHHDPTIRGLIFAHPDTIKAGIDYLRSEISTLVDFKSAYQLLKEKRKR